MSWWFIVKWLLKKMYNVIKKKTNLSRRCTLAVMS
jgi:hypothetical protein